MNYPRILCSIFIMAFVTYLPRMLPLAIFKKKINNRFIKSFLAYVPYAVLAAMTFPEILYATPNTSLSSSFCMISAGIGLLCALILARCKRGLLTVALGSSAAVFLSQFILSLL